MGQNDTSGFSCKTVCWLGALIAGVLVAALLMAMRDFGFLSAVFWGLVILLIGGFVLNWAFCGKSEEHASSASVSSGTVSGTVTTTPADSTATATPLVSTGDATVSSATAAATPAAAVSSAPKAKAAAKPKAAPKAKAATAKPVAKAKAAPKAKTAAAAKPVAADGKPELLKKARAGGADDLKQIKGVGPKLEGALHTMGVFHFDQIASWRKKEVEWADDNLDGVKGRVSRDEWVKQAKVLAKGGQTEFSQKVKKGGVY